MNIKLGFTGTRHGMTQRQTQQLTLVLSLLNECDEKEFHYGTHESVRLVADEQAAEIAKIHGFKTVPHHALRGEELDRDTRQVQASDVIVAAPSSDSEQVRSGTWATIRRARKSGKAVIMLSRGR